MASKPAIVATLRNAAQILDSFISYHLAIGFEHIYLFFDDEHDPSFDVYRHHPSVTAIRHDGQLRQLWRTLPVWSVVGSFIDREVMARQCLNASLAMRLATERGCTWLLHIDIDELFLPSQKTVKDHFDEAESGPADVITYLNFEGVPEEPDIEDYFSEITLFKVPVRLLPPLTADQERLIAATPQLSRQFFLYYENGKSAVRLGHALQPQGVHGFAAWRGPTSQQTSHECYILHYPCAGFEHFWTKYRTLGRFPDRFWEQPALLMKTQGAAPAPQDIVKCQGAFHLEARDVVCTGRRDLAMEFFMERVVMRDPNRIASLIQNGLVTRIGAPRELILRMKNAARRPAPTR